MKRKPAATDSGESVANRILDVATRMFADRGYGSVTTRQIAAKARVTFPTMYRRFPSKRELYLAACGAVLERAGSKYVDQVRQAGAAETRLLRVVTQFYDDLLTDPCLSKLVMREILDQDEKGLQHLTRNFFAPQYRAVREICRQLTDADDVDRVAFSIYAVAFGYVQLSPIGRTMSIGGRWKQPESMARMILQLILPAIDWAGVPKLTEPRAS
jgi:AcrR family transcriptional regulator